MNKQIKGKSNAMQAISEPNFVFNEVYIETIGVEFATKIVKINKYNLKYQFWDLSGNDRFEQIVNSYYRNLSGAMIFKDLFDKDCTDIEKQLKKLKELNHTQEIQVALVFSKYDLYQNLNEEGKREYDRKAKEMCEKMKNDFPTSIDIKISTKNQFNLEKLISIFSNRMFKTKGIDNYLDSFEIWYPLDENLMRMWREELLNILYLLLCSKKQENHLLFRFPKPILFKIITHLSKVLVSQMKMDFEFNPSVQTTDAYFPIDNPHQYLQRTD